MDRILVTGSDGLIGNALKRISSSFAYEFIFTTRSDGDLTSEQTVKRLYETYRPQYVIHTAARVGGIGANLSKPAEFFYENILMNTYMLHYAWVYGVKKCVAFSSVCSFADKLTILRENLQQEGAPYKDNLSYGYAKRMIDIQIQAYRKQHNCDFCAVIPTNMYGLNDNFSLTDGHVIPSLIHKCYIAQQKDIPLVLWGNGTSLREFIYADDAAMFTMQIMLSPLKFDGVILSSPKEYAIKYIAELICKCFEYNGKIVWDTSKPNGQHKRPSDISRLKSIVSNLRYVSPEEGIMRTVSWFKSQYPNIRGYCKN